MKKRTNGNKVWRKWLRSAWLPVLAAPLAVAVWVGYASYVIEKGMPINEDGSWSSEVLGGVHRECLADRGS